MPRKTKVDQERDWLRAVWEELAEAELRHSGFIEVLMKPTAQRGVFHVKMEFKRPDTLGGLAQHYAASQLQYPTARNTQYLPWLWAMAAKFTEYLSESDVALKAHQNEGG